MVRYAKSLYLMLKSAILNKLMNRLINNNKNNRGTFILHFVKQSQYSLNILAKYCLNILAEYCLVIIFSHCLYITVCVCFSRFCTYTRAHIFTLNTHANVHTH